MFELTNELYNEIKNNKNLSVDDVFSRVNGYNISKNTSVSANEVLGQLFKLVEEGKLFYKKHTNYSRYVFTSKKYL